MRHLRDQEACDLYDVLAELAYGAAARSRSERAAAFAYKHRQWLKGLPGKAEQVLYAMARQFERGGIEELETTNIFDAEDVKEAGGFDALKALRLSPGDLIIETKARLLAP